MRDESFFTQIEGYTEVKQDILSSRKYGIDMSRQSFLASELINRLHPKKLVLKVSQVIDEMDSVRTIRLVRDKGHLPPFEAGQYINLSVNIDGVVTSRPYSMSSAPSQTAYYDITVKRTDGGFVSNYLLDCLRVGEVLSSTAPAGEFHYNPLFHGDDLVMLAGGSGVTPMMSMIRQFASFGSNKNIHLIYICRTPEEVIFHKELERIEREFDKFRYTVVISRPKENYEGITGHITSELLASLLQNITDKTYYICGPTGMCDAAKNDLLSLGVRPGKIRQENFGESADVTTKPGWPESVKTGSTVRVKVVGSTTFDAPVGEPLLNSLDRAGVSVPSSCHSGECSLCRVKLLQGTVFHLADSKERVSDKKYGYIHSCSSYPTGDIEIEI
ncbi:MAG: hypothetical protein DRR06_15780 [Gammaproteobacteria bacterium]|nr:MAG: hypothetical protein DRR06_15780 [Gammaproteobacteria bacterium]